MITAEIRVNGALIGHLYARRIGPVSHTLPNEYECEYYMPDTGTINFKVEHYFRDGAENLMAKCFESLGKSGNPGHMRAYVGLRKLGIIDEVR